MKRILLFAGTMILLIIQAAAQKSEIFVKDGAAIRGYDAVAYFTSGKPVKGSKEFSVNYKDATWLFSSKQNAETFKANPEKYLPQYGGYCAYGLANGHKATTEPDAWTILNGKLYLNYDKDIQQKWNKKQADYIIAADKYWPTIKNKE
ncbi:MAG: YHS domain-containing (seleno)protein [Chitinophagaceae bacterium]